MDGDRITLDSATFKALSSHSRTSILKSLDSRRKTASELSRELGSSVQSVMEHIDSLRTAGLVDRAESGRKWVYYSLTEKGRAVLHPDTKKFWVLVALSLIAFALGAYGALYPGSFAAFSGEQKVLAAQNAPMPAYQVGAASATSTPVAQSASQIGALEEALLLAGAVLLGFAGWMKFVSKSA